MSGLSCGEVSVEVLTELLQTVSHTHRLERSHLRIGNAFRVSFGNPQPALLNASPQRRGGSVNQALALVVVHQHQHMRLGLAGRLARRMSSATVQPRLAV